MIAKLWCYLLGHKRGKRIRERLFINGTHILARTDLVMCPRCHVTWTRKAKA